MTAITYETRSLPPEIRNIIYDLALARSQITIYWDRSKKRLRQHPDDRVYGSLLRTCKKVYADARVMLYSTTVEIEDMEYLEKWLRQIRTMADHIRAIKLTQPFQASTARRNDSIGNFPLWNQRFYRVTSRRVAQLLSHCAHLESLELGFRYTLRNQNTTLLKPKDNSKPWEVVTQLLTEMVFSDFRFFLANVRYFGKTADQLANLLKIHPKNFEYISWYYYVGVGEDPQRESVRLMKLLIERHMGV